MADLIVALTGWQLVGYGVLLFPFLFVLWVSTNLKDLLTLWAGLALNVLVVGSATLLAFGYIPMFHLS